MNARVPLLPVYQDLPFRIIVAVAIAVAVDMLGRTESFWFWITTSGFWTTFLVGFSIAFALISYLRIISQSLDQRFSWLQVPVYRSGLQLVLGVVLPALVVHLLMFLQHRYLFSDSVYTTTWLSYELPFVLVIMLIINLYYFSFFLWSAFKSVNAREGRIVADAKITQVDARKGLHNFRISIADIAYVMLKDECYQLMTHSGEKYQIDLSLDDLMRQLDGRKFFRLNRQTIIQRNAFVSLRGIENGKLEVAVKPSNHELLIVSQKTSKSFKEWVRMEIVPE